ncbi:MAG: ABC transporter ATP-binding protein [Clostridiales bacterium]|nr:ABC transporter ATP-binding protein [Clostridiales bacterium]
MALITVKDLSIGYESKVVLKDISFIVNEGDYLSIVGENGAGKSTLMRTILGLQPPLKGEIAFGEGLRQNEIGYLPQQTSIQKDFPASVWEIVLSGCQARCGMRPFYGKGEKLIADTNISRMGISDLKTRCFSELSGGQQQRVLLARALCATRKLLLMDEPVAGLDPDATSEMYRIIDELNRNGVTIIMISHDLEAATRYSSNILHIGKEFVIGGGVNA